MGQPAARRTDAVAHKKGGGPVIEGSENVLIGTLPASRLGDKVQHNTTIETITEGEPTVLINGRPAARIGDKVGCGGVIAFGASNVHIGVSKAEACLQRAAEAGALVVVPED